MPEIAPSLPSPFAYTDFRIFVNDWIAAKIASHPDYNVSRFARAAGCSHSHVRGVLSENRSLNPPHVDGFLKALKLPVPQGEFFCTLVRYAQAMDCFERASLLKQMVGRLVFHKAPIPQGLAYVVIMDLRHMAIYEAANSSYFQDDPHWVARMMKILPEEAAESLAALKGAGLLVKGMDGRVRPAKPEYAVPPGMVAPMVTRLQDDAICLARREVYGRTEDRRFFVVTGPTADEDLPSLRMLVTDLIARVDGLVSQAPRSNDSVVYTVQVQLLPGAEAGARPSEA